jgi:methyltransferase (TIGR00027 family)
VGSQSRSALLVAACRVLADEVAPAERIMNDPQAKLFVDEAAMADARAQPELQRVIWLRTRYIDDAVLAFAACHPRPQILLLGAGFDSRAIRLDVEADFYEVDRADTVAYKAERFAAAGLTTRNSRHVLAVDLATEPIAAPLLAAGFDTSRPTIVVWEGVVPYLTNREAETVVAELASLLSTGSQLVADYGELGWKRNNSARSTNIETLLKDGGEPLRAGLHDAAASLAAAGFAMLDDEALDLLAPRYGMAPYERYYKARIFTAEKG